MRARVVTTTCDRCHIEADMPVAWSFEGGKLMLPHGWLHVSGVTTVSVAFVVDLCPDCKSNVLESAGVAPRR